MQPFHYLSGRVLFYFFDENRYDVPIKDNNAWSKMQKNLLHLSTTDTKQIFVPKSGHYINQDQPKAIKDAITEIVDKVKISIRAGFKPGLVNLKPLYLIRPKAPL